MRSMTEKLKPVRGQPQGGPPRIVTVAIAILSIGVVVALLFLVALAAAGQAEVSSA